MNLEACETYLGARHACGQSVALPAQEARGFDFAPGDRARLRGLPAVGRGCGGAIRGTQPEAEVIRRLSR